MTLSWLPGSERRPRRVALYSHDTQGLGHVRRNITVAAALVAADPETDVLLLTGAPEATTLPLPPRTDVITLPTLRKDRNGDYAARALGASLSQLLALRARMLTATLVGFAPDLLVVDKVPRGVDGELDEALTALRSTPTRVVRGLREVLDGPEAARLEWDAARSTEAVRDLRPPRRDAGAGRAGRSPGRAHDFVEQLPHGYDTVVGERGATLSGGQRQRIAIARAAVREAPIVVLDEALTGLDGETESEVVEALGRLTDGRTTFVITHDLEAARDSDRVVWVEDGRVVDAGPPDQVLDRARTRSAGAREVARAAR